MRRSQVQTPSSGGDRPENSPLRLKALEKRIRENPHWRDLWFKFIKGYSAAPDFLQELDYRIGSGKRNAVIEIWGPHRSGKSMGGLTVVKIIRGILEKRGIENPWALKWNYAQAKDEAFKYDGKGERVTILMDEDKFLSGPNSRIAELAYTNWLDQGPKLGHSLVKCSARRSALLRDYIACGLEVWGQANFRLLFMLYDPEDTEIGFLWLKYPDKWLRDWYESEKDKSLHELTLQGGNVGVLQSDDDLNAQKIYNETIKRYANKIRKLRLDHFKVVANRLFGALGVENCKMWATLAYSLYVPPQKSQVGRVEVIEPSKSHPKPVKPHNLVPKVSSEKLGKKWERDFAGIIALTLFDKYIELGKKGEPDGVAWKGDQKYVIGLEYSKPDDPDTTKDRSTFFLGERHGTRRAARLHRELMWAQSCIRQGEHVKLLLYIKEGIRNRMYGPYEIDLEKPRSITVYFDTDPSMSLPEAVRDKTTA